MVLTARTSLGWENLARIMKLSYSFKLMTSHLLALKDLSSEVVISLTVSMKSTSM